MYTKHATESNYIWQKERTKRTKWIKKNLFKFSLNVTLPFLIIHPKKNRLQLVVVALGFVLSFTAVF